MTNNDMIIYEQPITEQVRGLLRVEHIFNKIEQAKQDATLWGERSILASINDLLTIFDRPDFKNKLGKLFRKLIKQLQGYQQNDGLDQEQLNQFIKQLSLMEAALTQTSGKLLQNLRLDPFLQHLRTHFVKPGGACDFDSPQLHYWLRKANDERSADIDNWLAQMKGIKHMVATVLSMMRQSRELNHAQGTDGFYEQALNPKVPYQLVRIVMPKGTQAYPQISVGRHQLNIKFCQPGAGTKPAQVEENVNFELACCVL